MDYDQFYGERGGFKAASREWLVENTDLARGSGSLLDAGCGNGEWSMLLAEWYHVTGIDLSSEGIAKAREARDASGFTHEQLNFRCGDVLDVSGEIWDVIFCRAPSFLNLPCEHPALRANFERLLQYCPGGRLIYIKYSARPYERWVQSNYFAGFDTDPETAPDSRWYYNDPEKLVELIGQITPRSVRHQVRGNYILIEVGD